MQLLSMSMEPSTACSPSREWGICRSSKSSLAMVFTSWSPGSARERRFRWSYFSSYTDTYTVPDTSKPSLALI